MAPGTKADPTVDTESGKGTVTVAKGTAYEKHRTLAGVIVGDFMHNFCDGFFIAAGFYYCSHEKGWRILVGAVAHELAQELADFVLLTGPKVNLKAWHALLLNFLAGTSPIFGACVILASDISQSAVGLLLAFSAGIYLQIACTECMGLVGELADSFLMRILCIVAFILGCVCIGLVLLDHPHCQLSAPEPGVEADPHAGHNHGR